MVPRQLKKFMLFKGLNEKELGAVSKFIQKKDMPANNVILAEGAGGGKTLYMINKGKVKVSRMNQEGQEVVLTILGKGDFFGEMSLIDGSKKSADVTTVEASQVLAIPGKDFMTLLKKHHKVSMNLMQVLCRRIRRSDSQIKSLTLMNGVGRIASTLLRLSQPDGETKPTRKAQRIAKLPSREILSNMSGTTVPMIKKTLELFVKTGYAVKDGRCFTVKNPAAFHDMYCV
jgi:CRP/FNR family transcriptional regulator, cyclic AMP receptor protein